MIIFINTAMLSPSSPVKTRVVDPNRFIRQMYLTELYGVTAVYDQKAPPDAVAPYAVIRNISKTKEAVKCIIWRCDVDIDLYAEFTEIGNTAGLDELTDDILTAVTTRPLPAIENFGHARAELGSDVQDVIDNDELKQYRKSLRISHWVQA